MRALGGLARAAPRERAALAAILVVGLVLRIAFALDYERNHPLADRPVIDERSYERWALEIAGGDWIGDEVFFQEPLYPYWLGSVYAVWGAVADPERVMSVRRTAARHSQAFLGVVAVFLVWLAARRAFGPEAALVAAAGAATYRPLLYFPSLFLKPNLVVPCLALLAWCLARARLPGEPRAPDGPARGGRALWGWGAVGVVAGLGALLRGNVLVLLPALALWPLARALAVRAPLVRSGAAGGAAVAGGVLLVLAPVAARNHAVGGVLALSTSGAGTNLYGGNAPENPYGRATELPWVRGIPEHEAEDWRREAETRTGRAMDSGEVSRFWLRATLDSVAERPLVHLAILWRKLRLTLGRYELPDNHMLEWDARHVPLLRWQFPGWWLWGWLGLAGTLLVALRRPLRAAAPPAPAEAWTLLVLFALYLATIVLTVTSMRARLALVPLALPFAGWTVASALAALRASPARALPLLVPLALAAPAAWDPVLPPERRAEDLAKRDFNHAVYLLEEGELDAAVAIAERVTSERGPTSRLQTLLAEIDYWRALELRRAGDEAVARERLSAALARLAPVLEARRVAPRERFRAHALAGRVHHALGDWHEAERHIRAARAFDPDDPHLQSLLAEVDFRRALELRRAGDEAAARERFSAALAGLAPVLESRRVAPRERFRAHALAGRVHHALGDRREAERHLQAARAFDADDPRLRLWHAQALLLRARELAGEERRALLEESLDLLRGLRGEEGAPAAVGEWITDVEVELAAG